MSIVNEVTLEDIMSVVQAVGNVKLRPLAGREGVRIGKRRGQVFLTKRPMPGMIDVPQHPEGQANG